VSDGEGEGKVLGAGLGERLRMPLGLSDGAIGGIDEGVEVSDADGFDGVLDGVSDEDFDGDFDGVSDGDFDDSEGNSEGNSEWGSEGDGTADTEGVAGPESETMAVGDAEDEGDGAADT
jgi:hypothetical protein